MELTGQTALITGGASGIGRATVLEFARQGAKVILADVDAARAAEVKAEAAKDKLVVETVAVDLADMDSVAKCGAEVLQRFQRVDVLVNAAGWDRIQPFVDNTPEFIERVLKINLQGPVRLTQALLKPMIAAGRGKIVSVSSDAGRVGSMGETTYAAAKGGIIAFSKSLAREMARFKITVNVVCPGPTDTPLFAAQPEKLRDALARAVPFRRIGQPQEIADALLFFASKRSDYVTGQVLSVSGGLTMVG
jgi:2-hydroxycyclohexanecarboxyl-CoA dehydrogenase